MGTVIGCERYGKIWGERGGEKGKGERAGERRVGSGKNEREKGCVQERERKREGAGRARKPERELSRFDWTRLRELDKMSQHMKRLMI